MLEEALVAYGSDDQKGKELLKILSGLARHWGKHEEEAQERTPAELKNALMAQTGGGGGGPPPAPPGAPPGGEPPGGPPPGGPPG